MKEIDFRYYSDDGKGLPSVTELLKWIPKPYLIRWANKLGFQRKTYEEMSDYYTNIGQLVHLCNEVYIKTNSTEKVADIISKSGSDIIPIVLNCFKNFKRWYDDNKSGIEVIANEKTIKADRFAGTIDFIYKKGNDIYIMDFKSSSQVSVDYFIQLCAYYELCRYEDIKVTKVAVLRQDKYEDDFTYVEYPIEELIENKYLNLFYNILECYENYIEILNHYKNKNRKIQ